MVIPLFPSFLSFPSVTTPASPNEDIARLDLQASSQVVATEDPASATNNDNVAVTDDGATAVGGGAEDDLMSDEPSGSGRKLASATTRIVSAALRIFGI